MRSFKDLLIRALRLVYRGVTRKKFPRPDCECDRQVANDMIYDMLATNKPCMIARIGAMESNCAINYMMVNSNTPQWRKWWEYISGNTTTPWWNANVINALHNNAGVFPSTIDSAERFAILYLDDVCEIDILACNRCPSSVAQRFLLHPVYTYSHKCPQEQFNIITFTVLL